MAKLIELSQKVESIEETIKLARGHLGKMEEKVGYKLNE